MRLRLEGRAEFMETAREHHAALEGLLSQRRWLRRLRENPGSLQELLRQELLAGGPTKWSAYLSLMLLHRFRPWLKDASLVCAEAQVVLASWQR